MVRVMAWGVRTIQHAVFFLLGTQRMGDSAGIARGIIYVTSSTYQHFRLHMPGKKTRNQHVFGGIQIQSQQRSYRYYHAYIADKERSSALSIFSQDVLNGRRTSDSDLLPR